MFFFFSYPALGEALWKGDCHPISSAHQRLLRVNASITQTIAKLGGFPSHLTLELYLSFIIILLLERHKVELGGY